MAIKNLWGEFDNLPPIKPPVAILREQAQILEQATKGLLIGKIVPYLKDNEFEYTFYINAPSLNNYSYYVVTIFHNILLYPALINQKREKDNAIRCEDVENLEIALGKIFSSPEIRKVIAGLLAQIQSA